MTKILPSSDYMVKCMWRKQLQKIFSLLDSDNDGQISANLIDITQLSTEALETFAPLLCEMEDADMILDLATFINAAEKLLNVINY